MVLLRGLRWQRGISSKVNNTLARYFCIGSIGGPHLFQFILLRFVSKNTNPAGLSRPESLYIEPYKIEMNIVLIFVSTVDGKVTKWGDPHVQRWSSQKDHDYFQKTWNDSEIIIMGSTTFDVEPLPLSKDRILVIMTGDPSKYKNKEVLGQLEFTNETPKKLISRLKEGGFERVLVVGGPHISTSFLKDRLIDELWLTIEPRIFGSGGNFVTEEKLDINLYLKNYAKVNEEGTLILKYTVIK